MDLNTNFRANASSQAATYDEGLRQYMLKVYNYMTAGLFFTGIVAMLAAQSSAVLGMLYNMTPDGQVTGMAPLGWIVAFAPMAMVLLINPMRLDAQKAQLWFWVFSAIMGLSLTSILLSYTGASVARVFFITAATFGGMSIYGYTTKRDLTGMGSFIFMGLWGMMIVGLVNMFFLKSSALFLAMSVIGVLLAVGMTAYDTQKIKNVYFQLGGNAEMAQKASIIGAFQLYFDFIYLFVNLMHLMGERR